MLDKLLEVGSAPDWITPLVAMAQNRLNGPSHIFLIPYGCGWSGRGIKRLLESHGVQAWGLMVIDRLITVSVRLTQAHYAQYLLLQERIPIEYGLLEERDVPVVSRRLERAQNARAAPQAPPKRGIFAELSQVLDSLVDEVEAMLGLRG
jgi:hypothetical protein